MSFFLLPTRLIQLTPTVHESFPSYLLSTAAKNINLGHLEAWVSVWVCSYLFCKDLVGLPLTELLNML